MTSDGGIGAWYAPGDEGLAAAVTGSAWFKYDADEGNPNAALPVLIRLGVNDQGRHVCTGLIVGDVYSYYFGDQPREVNAAVLRSIHLPEVLSFALRTGDIPDEYGAAVRQLLDTAPSVLTHPGRAGYPDDHYERVAQLYRRALAEAPTAPTSWLQQRLTRDGRKVSGPTIRRWLAESRRRGHLGPTTQGRAGEGLPAELTEGLDPASPTFADDILQRIRDRKEGQR
jgi:hypothetical protein